MRRQAVRRRRPEGWAAWMLAVVVTVCGLLNAPSAAAQASVTTAEPEWRQDLDAWRARRAQEIASPDGWLTLAGLEWLQSGANSIGSAADNSLPLHAKVPEHIGLLVVSGGAVQLLPTVGGFPPDLTVDGQPAKEGPLQAGSRPSIVAWHGLALSILDRGSRFALRIKDSDAPARLAFKQLNWYPADPQWSVEAEWIPFATPHTETIPTALATKLSLFSPGVAVFTLNGLKLTLEPVLENPSDKTLLFIVGDATGKTTTYEGGRFLHVPLPEHGLDKPGKLILDFNRLENPACAYTTYANCPRPPEANRLPIALEAGEKRYTP